MWCFSVRIEARFQRYALLGGRMFLASSDTSPLKTLAHFRPATSDKPLVGKRTSLFASFASPPRRMLGYFHWIPPSFAPPSLRYGAAFVLRARRSSKSKGGLRATADKPGRLAAANLPSLKLTASAQLRPSGRYWSGIWLKCGYSETYPASV